MNSPDRISESLETMFWVKIIKFFDADQGGSGMEKIRSGIRDKHLGSATLRTSPVHVYIVHVCDSTLRALCVPIYFLKTCREKKYNYRTVRLHILF
jgi:hypothetical protein